MPLRDFLRGLGDLAPMMLAYAPISMLWGTIAAANGLSPFEAAFMSGVIYSGAAQFVLMDLWALATPLPVLFVTVFTLSLRHVLMSASVSRHMGAFSRLRATLQLFWLTDEAWAIIERRAQNEPITPAYFLGASMPIWPVWIAFTALGAAVGKALGNPAAWGLDYAFAAMFISVVAGFWKGASTGLILAASALAAVAVKLVLPGAWYILAGAAAGMIVAVLLYRDEVRT
ncbi:MAG: AzlC family ABC transporter permease [Proteobacteria bacterium]|nr:AzlC family ABC transporter permease [Pseudomonadota bacterium]